MRKLIYFVLLAMLLSCNGHKLSNELGCEHVSFSKLETIEDVHKNFTLELPKYWKTNLYYDNLQSSIYSADTTKQLTETYLIDVTHIANPITFDNNFFLQYKSKLTKNSLVETNSFETSFLDKPAYYSRAFGKKSNFSYEIINLFIKVNSKSHILAKVEVYGDSLTNERLCKAITLIEKTSLTSND